MPCQIDKYMDTIRENLLRGRFIAQFRDQVPGSKTGLNAGGELVLLGLGGVGYQFNPSPVQARKNALQKEANRMIPEVSRNQANAQ